MKSKTKTIITVAIGMAFIVAIIITSVVIITSEIQQTINTNFIIKYTVKPDTYATVDVNIDSNGVKNEDSSFTFLLEGESATGTFDDINEIIIDPNKTEQTACVEIAITNNQPDQEEGSTDLFIKHGYSKNKNTNINATRLISFDNQTNYKTFNEESVQIKQGQTVYIKMLFEVKDIFSNAEISGTISLEFVHVSKYSQLPQSFLATTLTEMGEYPQEYVGNRLNSTIKKATLNSTGKTYTINNSITLTEYTYNDIKVAKLTNSGTYLSDYYNFSTGEQVKQGEVYFFYVQPIQVVLMEVRENKAIYMTKSLLFSHEFDNSSDVWETSSLRTFLNGTFKNQCGITATSISLENGLTEQNYTDDLFWVPSQTEMLNWYSFDSARKKKPTDMALATYTYYYKEYDAGYYWTRTAGTLPSVYTVRDHGAVDGHENFSDSAYGVSVCFAISV